MRNVLQDGAEWLSRQRKAHANTLITYWRGTAAIQVWAQKVNVNMEMDLGDGVIVESQRMDWVIAVEDLAFDGAVSEPEAGDRIVDLVDSEEHTYEVMPLGTDSHFRAVSPFATGWRIHSKRITVT